MTQSRPDPDSEEEKKAAAKKAPEVDHRAAAAQKLDALKMYRAAGLSKKALKEPEVDATERGGITQKLKDFKEFKDQDKLSADWRKVSDSQPDLVSLRNTMFDEAKKSISDHVKELHPKSDVKKDVENSEKGFIQRLESLASSDHSDEIKQAASRLLKGHQTEFAKLHGEHYDAEMKRVDTSLGLQKSLLLSQDAAEKAGQYQKWKQLGWFATNEFGAKMLAADEEKARQSEKNGNSAITVSFKGDELANAFEEFRKNPSNIYKSTTSPFYMEISGVERDDDGYVKKCSVKAVLQPGAKDNGKSKQEALSFLAQKVGVDSFTIQFRDFEGLTRDNQKARIKDMKEWIAEANKRVPPMKVDFGNGCQDAIDKCGIKDIHVEMEKLLQENRAKVSEYATGAENASKHSKEVDSYKAEKETIEKSIGAINSPAAPASSFDAERKNGDIESCLKKLDAPASDMREADRLGGVVKSEVASIDTELANIKALKQQLDKEMKALGVLAGKIQSHENNPKEAGEHFYDPQLSTLKQKQKELLDRVDKLDKRMEAFSDAGCNTGQYNDRARSRVKPLAEKVEQVRNTDVLKNLKKDVVAQGKELSQIGGGVKDALKERGKSLEKEREQQKVHQGPSKR